MAYEIGFDSAKDIKLNGYPIYFRLGDLNVDRDPKRTLSITFFN